MVASYAINIGTALRRKEALPVPGQSILVTIMVGPAGLEPATSRLSAVAPSSSSPGLDLVRGF